MKRAVIAILVVGMLVTGSVNTIAKKVGYDTCSKGEPGVEGTPTSRGVLPVTKLQTSTCLTKRRGVLINHACFAIH